MSNFLATFDGVLAVGSLQSNVEGYEAVPLVQVAANGYAPSQFQSGGVVVTDLYAPILGPLLPTFGGVYNFQSNGLVVNRTWTPAQSLNYLTLTAASVATTYSFSLTSVIATIGNTYNGYTVYTGTITGGANNAFVGYTFTVSGFSNGGNNGLFYCIASTATTLTVYNSAAVVESASATAATGTTVYTGTIVGGGTTGGYAGDPISIAGFSNGGNNGTFTCLSSTATTLTLLNSGGVAESHAGTAIIATNALINGATINVTVAPVGNPDLGDSAYVAGLSVGMNTATQANFSGSSSAMGVVAIETENSVGLPSGDTSTVFINQVIGLYTESLIGNYSNPDGVYNMNSHWNYHCAGMGFVGHATGTITNSAGIFMEGPRVPAGCTLTARYGIYMQPQNQNSGGTNTNAWGIYEASSAEKNQLGIIICGTSITSPSVILTGTVTDGLSSVGTSGQVLSSTVTGTKWVTPEPSIYGQTGGTPVAGDNHIVSGKATLAAGTVTVTLSGAAAFADTNYIVTALYNEATTPANALCATVVSGTTFVITSSSAGDTANVFWLAVGTA